MLNCRVFLVYLEVKEKWALLVKMALQEMMYVNNNMYLIIIHN